MRLEQVEYILIDVVTSCVIRFRGYLLAYKVGQFLTTNLQFKIQRSKLIRVV